ncbi:hypothetical protein U1Q18_047735 [Sarracenia purpurea var. burkii]
MMRLRRPFRSCWIRLFLQSMDFDIAGLALQGGNEPFYFSFAQLGFFVLYLPSPDGYIRARVDILALFRHILVLQQLRLCFYWVSNILYCGFDYVFLVDYPGAMRLISGPMVLCWLLLQGAIGACCLGSLSLSCFGVLFPFG